MKNQKDRIIESCNNRVTVGRTLYAGSSLKAIPYVRLTLKNPSTRRDGSNKRKNRLPE